MVTSSAPQPADAPSVVDGASSVGLTSDEASARLARGGPNLPPDTTTSALRMAIEKFWTPVPWMLEASIALQLALGKLVEAGIIAALLLFNAVLGFVQEWRSRASLAALRSRLALTASVRRDGVWRTCPAADLVAGDVVMLSLGRVVPADATLLDGNVLLDQSVLTGESIATEAGPGFRTYSGALVRRGEATALVTATGAQTKFGKTAALVLRAHVVSSQQRAVLGVVRNLALFNGTLTVGLVVYAWAISMPVREIIPLVLTAVLASIPVALPATFTLAAALGARSLAALGALPTRLSAVDEAATIDILCADKTGTLTRNQLSVEEVRPMSGSDAGRVLEMAALASSTGGQDPVDAAIRSAAAAAPTRAAPPELIKFTPFDPATKMSEATVRDAAGALTRIVKGANAVIAALTPPSPQAAADAHDRESKGFRVLAVAAGQPGKLSILGLISLSDPARSDAAALVAQLSALGVRTVMVTGDAPATAEIVARAVGLHGDTCPPGPIPDELGPKKYSVFAGVLPEEKYDLVKAFQRAGHSVGMCGDGANDAPALRRAQIGIAVSTATDVARSAAGVVLTDPGLAGVVASVKEGRLIFQRILNYTLNSLTKKIVQVLLLAAGLLMTGHAVLTPLLMVIIMVTGDLLGMSSTTDHVTPSPLPNRWRIGNLTLAGTFLGVSELAFCIGVLAAGWYIYRLDLLTLRTLAFFTVVCGNQATTYVVRSRRRIWSAPHPSRWLVASSAVDLSLAAAIAQRGWLMSPLAWQPIGCVLAGAAALAVLLAFAKRPVFAHLEIA